MRKLDTTLAAFGETFRYFSETGRRTRRKVTVRDITIAAIRFNDGSTFENTYGVIDFRGEEIRVKFDSYDNEWVTEETDACVSHRIWGYVATAATA